MALFAAATLRCAAPSPAGVPQSSPQPASVASSPSASGVTLPPEEQKGNALIQKAVDAMGGARAVDAVRSLDLHGKAKRVFPSGEEVSFAMRTSILFPGRFRQEVELPMVRLVTVLGPDGAYTDMGDGPVLLPEAQRMEFDQSYRRNLLAILRSRTAPDFRAVAKGSSDAGDDVEVQSSGIVVTLTIDRASGRILRLRFTSVLGTASKENVTEYSDWRKTSALTYPFAASTLTDGKPANGVVLDSVGVDSPLDPELFQPKTAPVPSDAPDPAPTPAAPAAFASPESPAPPRSMTPAAPVRMPPPLPSATPVSMPPPHAGV